VTVSFSTRTLLREADSYGSGFVQFICVHLVCQMVLSVRKGAQK